MNKFLHLAFLPRSADLALLVLRVVFGVAMLWLHGRGKLMRFGELSGTFSDPLGVGPTLSLVLALVGEIVCSALIIVGAFTRLAALGGLITMAVAFFLAHGGKLSGPGNGELAFAYLTVFTALLIAGAGRFSVDAKLGVK